MKDQRDSQPTFGIVDFEAEHGLFQISPDADGICTLILVTHTERGYPRRELATISRGVWNEISNAVSNELLRGMTSAEKGAKLPSFRPGTIAVGALITRELAVLLWSLMEDSEGTHPDALLSGWRQLAREERWWLYARASNTSQRQGQGWRRALFFALNDPAETRSAPRISENNDQLQGAVLTTDGEMRRENTMAKTQREVPSTSTHADKAKESMAKGDRKLGSHAQDTTTIR